MGNAFLILPPEPVGKVSVLFLKSFLIKSMIANKQVVIRWFSAVPVCMECDHELLKFKKKLLLLTTMSCVCKLTVDAM